MKALSPRQQSILNRVVDAHIETAQPVGSRFITDLYTEMYRSSYSSATVRNEMGQLEDMGYLMHPHTSAGRIPTDLGYRYYVDHGLPQEDVKPDFREQVGRDLRAAAAEWETLLEKASGLLSHLAGEVSLILVPGKRGFRLYLQGSSRLFEKPEFQDYEKMKKLFHTFEEKAELVEWLLQGTASRGVSVKIGQENRPEALRPCAVVSTLYRMPTGEQGILGVLGPKRMRYSRAIALVQEMGRMMDSFVEEKNG